MDRPLLSSLSDVHETEHAIILSNAKAMSWSDH